MRNKVNAKVMEGTIPDISHEKNDEKAVSKKRMDELYKKLKAYVDNNGVSQVNVYQEDTGVSIVIVDNLIFDTGDANVKPEAKEVISQLVGFFQSVPNPIVVEGHQIADRLIMKNSLPTGNYLQHEQLI